MTGIEATDLDRKWLPQLPPGLESFLDDLLYGPLLFTDELLGWQLRMLSNELEESYINGR